MKSFGLLAASLAALAGVSLAARGVDVSSAVYENNWSCLAQEGYSYAIVRAHLSNGGADPTAPHTIYNFYASDMGKKGGRVDLYLFPNVPAGNPSYQVTSVVDYLKGYDIHYSRSGGDKTYSTVWLDIEPYAWSSDKAANADFIAGMMHGCEEAGVQCGIYANWNSWAEIAGEWSGASHLPLWYPIYDGSESCSDFRAFGGWSRPSKKQWQGNDNICGAGVDLNVDC